MFSLCFLISSVSLCNEFNTNRSLIPYINSRGCVGKILS